MHSRRFTGFVCAFLMILCITGCGKEKSEEELPETVMTVTVQYTLSGQGNTGTGCILIGDTLYYTENVSDYSSGEERSGNAICRKEGKQEAEKLAEFFTPEQILCYYLADLEGSVYYLYIEAEKTAEDTADYRVYLRKESAGGEDVYCTLVDEETVPAAEGESLWDTFPEEIWKWYGVNDGAVDGQNRICLHGRNNMLFLFDSAGFFLCEQEYQRQEEGNSETGIVNAGALGCYLYEAGEERVVIRKIDTQTGSLSPAEKLPFRPEEITSVLSGYDSGILINTSLSLYCYQPSGSAECLLDWGDLLLAGYDVRQVGIDGENYQLLVRSGSSLKLMKAENTEAADTSGKQKITVGVAIPNVGKLKELAAGFNESNTAYQIEIVGYEHKPDGLDELYKQLLKGEGPDIFELHNLELSMDILADKGILEDLTPWFGQSGTVGIEDILPRVIEAGTRQGKLVALIPAFSIGALAVEQGHTTNYGWTPEEFLAYAAGHPDSAVYKMEKSYAKLLNTLMAGGMDKYIDWEKKECSFDTEDFIRLLTAVKQTNISAADIENEKGKEGFLAGKYLVVEYRVTAPEYYADAMDYIEGYGEIVGYPASSGEPYFIMYPAGAYGINSRSESKEGAWAFLEYVLAAASADPSNKEKRGSMGWPARIDAFEIRLENSIFDRTQHMSPRLQFFSGEVLVDVPLPEITEEIKEFLRFIVDNMYYDNSGEWTAEYRTIILEEAGAYFAGDKTAEQAAELIQNRVSLFLSE